MDFLAEFFGGRFSVAFTVLTAEKHTPNIWGKIRWKISVKHSFFLVRFAVRFSVSNFLPRNRKHSCRIRSARKDPLTQIPQPKSIVIVDVT